MKNAGLHFGSQSLSSHGIETSGTVYWNLTVAGLYEQAIRRNEVRLAEHGPMVTTTGRHTGRSPNDRFLVRDAENAETVWWGPVNVPFDAGRFERLRDDLVAHLRDRDLFVFSGYAGADPAYRLKVRVINELAWHNLFARNMFLRESDGRVLEEFAPDFTVVGAPDFKADPEKHGTNSSTFIVVSFAERLVIIGGSKYAGEIKKSIFSVMNYLLPERGVMPMHCSCNYGTDRDDVALFFGLSGTGKTTISADPERTLIGDDEHGWSDAGIFNMEGGCYAKMIRLSAEGEPEIYATTRKFGTVLENVVVDAAGTLDLDDASLTENTRGSYPLTHLDKVDTGGVCGHPKNVVFLTADAFGVLPPISRLTPSQAQYHFLSGYTAKVAGTERGVTEPQATFSACFGAPFMPRHPGVYSRMLAERSRSHGAEVWLVNTGWSGGPHGVGRRIELGYTRRMVRAALSGELAGADFRTDPIFGVAVPKAIDRVPKELLDPRSTWPDPSAYDAKADALARMFVENFSTFADGVSREVRAAAPVVA
jgi:phosphoenolpyruvate carboxykinase (ATP)